MFLVNRKNIRLVNKDAYKSNNYFFITICVQNRRCLLGEVEDKQSLQQETRLAGCQRHSPTLSEIGKIVHGSWISMPNYIGNICLDEFVVMPNHVHGIIGFNGVPYFKNSNVEIDLSQVIASFKSKSTNFIRRRGLPLASHSYIPHYVNNPSHYLDNNIQSVQKPDFQEYIQFQREKFSWQKSFYDHVIRSQAEFDRIKQYIRNNPANWHKDTLYILQ